MRKALDRRIFMSGPKIPTVIRSTASSPPGSTAGSKGVQRRAVGLAGIEHLAGGGPGSDQDLVAARNANGDVTLPRGDEGFVGRRPASGRVADLGRRQLGCAIRSP